MCGRAFRRAPLAYIAARGGTVRPFIRATKRRWSTSGRIYGDIVTLRHDIMLIRKQQFATFAIHKRFFVWDHILSVGIRCKERFCPGNVIEPDLRDAVELGSCCPW